MIIRHAAMEDLKAVTELEAKCFPAAEAAGRAAFFDRLASFPDHFWLLYEDEKLVSMINGMATDEEHLTDAMYEHADMHSKDGAWQMIFGVHARKAPDEMRELHKQFYAYMKKLKEARYEIL